MAKSNSIIKIIQNKINSEDFLISNRISEKYFTRKRKLHFPRLVVFLLNLIKKTAQKELTQFMNIISDKMTITKSALTQQRIKLKPEAFIELNEDLVDEFYHDDDYKKWNNFRLLAIDGSGLALPKSDDLRNFFGINTEQNNLPSAKIGCFYDVLNEIIIDSKIDRNTTNEYDLAIEHLKKSKFNDLIIFDRGYGARWLFYFMQKNDINYVVRIQKNFGNDIDAFWDSDENSKIIVIENMPERSRKRLKKMGIDFTSFEFRLVKVILDNGEIEILATSLLDSEKYPDDAFKELYFKRWPIETNYKHLKNHMELGDFTGLTVHAIQQDFYANMFIANLQSVIVNEAQVELDNKQKKKSNKYHYKINKNLSLAYMKDKIVDIFINDNNDCLEELKSLFLEQPVPIRKNRKFPRNHKKKRPYFMNQKRAI